MDDLGKTVEEKKLSPVKVPALTASNFKALGTGVEIILILERILSLADDRGNLSDVAMLQPVATVTLAPGAAKDLSLVLADQVKKHEAKFGVISTPFSQKMTSK